MYDQKKILLVDDDADDRFFFQRAVKKIDGSYECITAQNGEDALEKLRAAARLPDYIFLDLNMPLMNGKACLAELKRDERLKNIPVIIYTTSNFSKDFEDTMKMGAAHYMTKTSDINLLSGIIVLAMVEADKKQREFAMQE
jgi:CheY-like chemotaxis protein